MTHPRSLSLACALLLATLLPACAGDAENDPATPTDNSGPAMLADDDDDASDTDTAQEDGSHTIGAINPGAAGARVRWWQSGWPTNTAGVKVAPYSHNRFNVGPNFFNLVADHEKWRAYHGDFDMVDGSAMRGWRPQNWETYVGGPVSAGPTSVVDDSWLQLLQSTHVKPWFDYARDWPNMWLVANMVSMPTSSHGGTTLTEAQQTAIVEDIIAGRKDADLVMLGRRLRHQIEHLAGGARAGSAERVMLRVNWEFQHTTSLGIAGNDFLDYYVAHGLSEAQAAEKYRRMMHVWTAKVRNGYAMDHTPAVRLRIAISFAHMKHRGIPMAAFIQDADDYDMVDMMYHPSRDSARTADAVWGSLWTPGVPGQRYSHADALAAAREFNLAYGTLESGPRYEMDDRWGDLYTPERGFVAPNAWSTGQAIPLHQYRITDQNNVYQLVTRGPGNATIKPTHRAGRAKLRDGYEWAFRINLGRKLAPYEFSDLVFRDFHKLSGRSAFIGSYHPTSANPNYVNGEWSAADKNVASPTSKASDWRRFVEMRRRWLGERPL